MKDKRNALSEPLSADKHMLLLGSLITSYTHANGFVSSHDGFVKYLLPFSFSLVLQKTFATPLPEFTLKTKQTNDSCFQLETNIRNVSNGFNIGFNISSTHWFQH